ncbi:unnamed protein product [Tenebrio molitor]|nr:unnamed protein product [Tenebrio molitor]
MTKYSKSNAQLSFLTLCTGFVRTMFEQPVNVKNRFPKKVETPVFIILASWWIFSMIINAIYKSKLSSLMVSTPTYRTTFGELVDEGYEIALDKTRSYIQMFLEEEESLINRPSTIWENGMCDLHHYIGNNKALIAGEVTLNFLHSKIYCSDDGHSKLLERFSTQLFGVTPHAWLFKTDAPFVDRFSIHIKKVMGGGLLQVWEQEALLKSNLYVYSKKIINEDDTSIIRFESFILELAIYLALIIVSIVLFFFEIVYYSLQKKRR